MVCIVTAMEEELFDVSDDAQEPDGAPDGAPDEGFTSSADGPDDDTFAGDGAGGNHFGGVPAPLLDPSLLSRVSAVSVFRPIAEAADDNNLVRFGWSGEYDITSLSVCVIDMVMSRQGFGEGEYTWLKVVSELKEAVWQASPDADPQEHQAVAEYVVKCLLNRKGSGGARKFDVHEYDNNGLGVTKRPLSVTLLYEATQASTGEVVLKVTPQAINALVGALDNVNVGDAQWANDLMLARQMEQGRFDTAAGLARKALALSVQYGEELTELLNATQRDLRTVESRWTGESFAFLDVARDHLQDRLDAEGSLRAKAEETLLSTSDDNVRVAAARIIELLEQCRDRHNFLHAKVIVAIDTFLYEQNRQGYRQVQATFRPDINTDILLPLLRLSRDEACDVGGAFLRGSIGPVVPRIPRLYRLLNDLVERPEFVDDDVDDLEEEYLEPPSPRLDDDVVHAAVDVVRQEGLPARLSALLMSSAAAGNDGAVLEALAVAAVMAVDPGGNYDDAEDASETLAHRVFGSRAVATRDGAQLSVHGYRGDDLLIMPDVDDLFMSADDNVSQEAV